MIVVERKRFQDREVHRRCGAIDGAHSGGCCGLQAASE